MLQNRRCKPYARRAPRFRLVLREEPRSRASWQFVSRKPAAGKACSPQACPNRLGTTHDVPEQTGAVVLDHQNDRTLIDPEVIRRNPPTGRALVHGERLVE